MLIKIVAYIMLMIMSGEAGADSWRGLTVANEHRCSQYSARDYRYGQSVEPRIAESLGGMWSPYDLQEFSSLRQTDIEHIIARSEAHDSGLCAASPATRKAFASDLLNLTLASPDVNRKQKSNKDFSEWQPAHNSCWMAGRIVEIRRKYGLTVDAREAVNLEAKLQTCRRIPSEPTGRLHE